MNNLVRAVLVGLLAFVICLVALLIIAAILGAVGVGEAGAIVSKFAWVIAVLAGILTGWNQYNGGTLR